VLADLFKPQLAAGDPTGSRAISGFSALLCLSCSLRQSTESHSHPRDPIIKLLLVFPQQNKR